MTPGTYFGPVQWVAKRGGFVTVLVNGWWINVQNLGIDFAKRVPDDVVHSWHVRGWTDTMV